MVSGAAGLEVVLGALTFAAGMIVCTWDLVRAVTMRIGEGGFLD
jgi:hypothetical protein